jgi:hypothetical protein
MAGDRTMTKMLSCLSRLSRLAEIRLTKMASSEDKQYERDCLREAIGLANEIRACRFSAVTDLQEKDRKIARMLMLFAEGGLL